MPISYTDKSAGHQQKIGLKALRRKEFRQERSQKSLIKFIVDLPAVDALRKQSAERIPRHLLWRQVGSPQGHSINPRVQCIACNFQIRLVELVVFGPAYFEKKKLDNSKCKWQEPTIRWRCTSLNLALFYPRLALNFHTSLHSQQLVFLHHDSTTAGHLPKSQQGNTNLQVLLHFYIKDFLL